MIGKKLSPILEEIEMVIIDFEVNSNEIPNYSNNAFRAATKIFMSALMDKMWRLQSLEDLDKQDRLNMAQKAGEELRRLIKTYTAIDTKDFYIKQ